MRPSRKTGSCAAAVVTAVVLLALPTRAQVPAQPTAPAPAPAATLSDKPAEEPSVEERRIVAFVSTGVAVASLATGVTLGVLAQVQFDCAKDIIACNGTLENKVVGDELFDVRAEIDQRAILADMAFLFAGAAAVVATVGYLRGFVFVDEEAPPAVAGLLPQAPTFANLAPVAADVVVTP
ncbi:MAG: hypothetical protein Q8O67_00370 [Deltaproteobacteria bacterium]|nr:hypothetical protein [Deltaproteobacteria bacterium]